MVSAGASTTEPGNSEISSWVIRRLRARRARGARRRRARRSNAGDLSLAKRRATSTASSITTSAGVSGSNRSSKAAMRSTLRSTAARRSTFQCSLARAIARSMSLRWCTTPRHSSRARWRARTGRSNSAATVSNALRTESLSSAGVARSANSTCSAASRAMRRGPCVPTATPSPRPRAPGSPSRPRPRPPPRPCCSPAPRAWPRARAPARSSRW